MTATKNGTYNFAKRFSHYKDFYVKHNNLIFSKLGLGTFNKEPYKEENYVYDYIKGVKEAIKNGVNLIDTASNYRYGRSEKEISLALSELFESGEVKREELIVCSKGGFIQLEYPFPENPHKWIEDNIIKTFLAKREDIELDQHCMTPDFLEWSCKKSLDNLHIDCIDIYFLHNPEMQMQKLKYDKFLDKIGQIFERFETLVSSGQIKSYGVAVWNAFINHESLNEHINLEDLVKVAQKVGGENHNFKYAQTPFNMAKTPIYTMPTQSINGEKCTLLQAAHRLKIGVISSSSLLQMNLFKSSFKADIGYLLDSSLTLENDIQLALQFVRSTLGIVSSLFVSKEPKHIKNNLQISKVEATVKRRYDLMYRV